MFAHAEMDPPRPPSSWHRRTPDTPKHVSRMQGLLRRNLTHEARIGCRCPPLLPAPDCEMVDGDTLPAVGRLKFHVLGTPGHSPGSVCLYDEHHGLVFTGDLLFNGLIGRTDKRRCRLHDTMQSLGKLMALPSHTACFPGHREMTTIGRERDCNPFLHSFRTST